MIAQEIVRAAQRSDISEEVTRFRAHLAHWAALAGRRRAVRPQARFPAAGDEPRDQHHRRRRPTASASRSSSSTPRRSSRRCASRSRMSSSVPSRVEAERGLLFIVSAPSGTGKTTLVERLVQLVPDLRMSRSYTSRPARAGEQDGVDYNFISRERFEAMIGEEAFLEWADVFGNYYGTSAADTEAVLARRRGRGARHRRAGRPAGPRAGASRPSASSCCRPRRRSSSSGCAAAARTARSRSAAARRGVPRGRASSRSTSTSSSTTSWTRRSSGCRRSSPPSARGCNACGRRPKPS